jgi:DNA-directed RNA polymerase specialized sigma24 family protein
MSMRTTAIPVTAESFEKLFVRNFHNTIGLDPEYQFNDENPQARKKYYPDSMDWRHIAWRALVNNEFGDVLRRAILALPVKYREVLFLRDVKNLDTEEAAWVLGIAGGAVKAWLSRARTQVRDALTSALSSKLCCKCSNLGNFYCDFPRSGLGLLAILR